MLVQISFFASSISPFRLKSLGAQGRLSLSNNATSPVGTEHSKSPARKCRVGDGKDRVPKGTARDDIRPISLFGGSTLTPQPDFPIRVAAAVCPINSTHLLRNPSTIMEDGTRCAVIFLSVPFSSARCVKPRISLHLGGEGLEFQSPSRRGDS